MDSSFDPKTLTNGNDRELWNKKFNQVKLMFNTCIKTPLAKMICNNDSVKERPHLIWKNIVAYYEDSAMAQSNPSLIAICLSQIHTSQFTLRMDFLAKFLSKIDCYNHFADKNMSHSICISHLNRAISKDKILNTKVTSIKKDEQHPSNKRNKTGKMLNIWITLLTQFPAAVIQLDGAQMLVRETAVKTQDVKHNLYNSHWDKNRASTIIQSAVWMHLSRLYSVNYQGARVIQSLARMYLFLSDYFDYQADARIQAIARMYLCKSDYVEYWAATTI